MKTKMRLSISILFLLSLLLAVGTAGFLPGLQMVNAEVETILSADSSWGYPSKEYFSSFQKGTELGIAVSMTKDVTGDGLDDILVGAQRYEVSVYREGAVFVFAGSYKGLSSFPIWEMGGRQQGSLFGCAVSSLGDVNGDGQNDVAVGACEYTSTFSKAGAAFVYYGPLTPLKTSEDWSFIGDQKDARLGSALSGAVDINGDGINDLIVGAKNYSEGLDFEGKALNNNGKVFIFYGSDPDGLSLTPDWEAIGENSAAQFGSSVANAGDINGDGRTDLIIGAPRPSDIGKIYVYLNTESGLPSTPSQVITNNEMTASFGAAIAGVGYVNNDAYADVLVGAPYAMNHRDEKTGCVYLYWGSPTGLSSDPWVQCGEIPYELFGYSVAAAGDMNNDNFDDFLVGIPKYSDQVINPGEEQQGAVYLYFGSPTGVRSDYFESTFGKKAETMFGAAIGGIGDVNHDGKPDVIVGAPNYKVDLKNPIGRILAYYAGEAGIPDLDNFSIFLPLVQR